MPSPLNPHVSALHNALAEERPTSMREALRAGAHPLDRNADGQTAWDVILSTKLSSAATAPTLGEQGTAAREFKDVVLQMAEMPPRGFEEALMLFGYEKQAIEKKHQGLTSAGVEFVRDCLGRATQVQNAVGLSWLQQHEVLHARHANHLLEQRLGTEPLVLSGNAVSVPLSVGPASALKQTGSAPLAFEVASQEPAVFQTLEDRRSQAASPAPAVDTPKSSAPKP